MRQLLEASWNADTMGDVPSDATIAAKEAYGCIQAATSRGTLVHFVDLLLPAYDVSFGSHLYDQVVAVEYCIALAECFPTQTEILVRDDATLRSVERILTAREQTKQEEEELMLEVDDDDDEVDEDDDEDADETTEISNDTSNEEDENEDKEKVTPGNVDDFRKQLMADWDAPAATDTMDNTNTGDDDSSPPKSKVLKPKESKSKSTPTEKRYRLASLFGTARISKDGPDVMEQVVKALQANALPHEEEDTMIILSAITREEMIAVRSLVAKYGTSSNTGSNTKQRTIVLVNCKLHPIPREMFGAETVYSILPMTVRPKAGDLSKEEVPQPKVLLLRRYPGDWQVFVDLNDNPQTKVLSPGPGFQLADTAPSNRSNQRGPPMDWVQQVVQQYLEAHS